MGQDKPDRLPSIQCGKHKKMPWTGQVLCAIEAGGCGRVWHLNHGHEPKAHGVCDCGKVLVARSDAPEAFTARAICPACYAERRAAEVEAEDAARGDA